MSARAELEAALAPLMEGVVEGEPTLATQREGQDRFGDLFPLPPGAEVRDEPLGGVPARFIEFPDTSGDAVMWPEMLHIFPYFAPLLADGHVAWQALDQMTDFVRRHAHAS